MRLLRAVCQAGIDGRIRTEIAWQYIRASTISADRAAVQLDAGGDRYSVGSDRA
jgi:hypothetical protein